MYTVFLSILNVINTHLIYIPLEINKIKNSNIYIMTPVKKSKIQKFWRDQSEKTRDYHTIDILKHGYRGGLRW